MDNISIQEQAIMVDYVSQNHDTFKFQLEAYNARMLDIYQSVSSFKRKDASNWETDFKVNKLFVTENKITPRIIANPPKRLVSVRTDTFDEWDDLLSNEEKLEKNKKTRMYADAIRDYLSNVFKKQDLKEVTKLRAKNWIRYWLWRSKVCYRYDYDTDIKNEEYEESVIDDNWNVVEKKKRYKKKSNHKVVSEYPSIDIVSRSDLFYDPRYIRLEDMPWLIEVKSWVRMSFFTKDPKKYINIDKLIEIARLDRSDMEWYKQQIQAITGINVWNNAKIDINNLTVKKFYWRYEPWVDENEKFWKEEKLYEIWTINDLLVVYCQEISQLPFQEFKCFEDTESFIATWFLEWIISLQDELNFKKNSASLYTNQSLYRNWIWSANSGINPKHLNSRPWNIIPTTKDWQTAQANLIELPFRQLPPNYWQEQNDFERQIQEMSFIVDASSQQSNQAMTNTATWMKIKAFESNSVVNMVRENYENALVMLAYKFLQATFENLDDNAIIKKMWSEWFREINKEAMRDAFRRYEIKVESWSTSFDTEEQRRNNAIAQSNISLQYAQAWVPVDLTKQYLSVMETFEWTNPDELLKPVNPMEQLGWQQAIPWWLWNMPMQEKKPAWSLPI